MPSSSTVPGSPSSAVDVRAGRGRLQVNDVSGAFARSTLAGVPAAAHTDLLLSDGWTSASAQSYFNVFVRDPVGGRTATGRARATG